MSDRTVTARFSWATVELVCCHCESMLTAPNGSQFFLPIDLQGKMQQDCDECGRANLIPAAVRKWAK